MIKQKGRSEHRMFKVQLDTNKNVFIGKLENLVTVRTGVTIAHLGVSLGLHSGVSLDQHWTSLCLSFPSVKWR